ncbi:MAG TPA: phosphoribosyltransferase [Candidatus Dormibacteraeota bacterium]|nr:phosphoribosyltransferase [Candidatus Dormibacteraeota bacterium]
MRFRNRSRAGQLLAELLRDYIARADVLVLALPRGGVPVGYEVAKHLRAPLDVIVVRKLGVPGHRELAMGAIASGGVMLLNEDVVGALDIPRQVVDSVVGAEQQELERRERVYRAGRPLPDVQDQTVIVVDDGLATGASMLAAVRALRRRGAQRIVVAVPVAAADTCTAVRREADECICLVEPAQFYAVGAWYEDFSEVSDDEVCDLLERARIELGATPL